jgi:hypothetical protein
VGFSDEDERKDYQQKLEKKKELAAKAEKSLEKTKEKFFSEPENKESQKKVFDHVISASNDTSGQKSVKELDEAVTKVSQETKTKYITDDLARLNKKERKLVSRIFKVIDNALPIDLSNVIKEKIKEELQ